MEIESDEIYGQYLDEKDLKERFDDYTDGLFEPYQFGEVVITPSDALKKHCALYAAQYAEWRDKEITDGRLKYDFNRDLYIGFI